jgi:NADPH:quinone reductase-like Zn-dependent oxidoreductase
MATGLRAEDPRSGCGRRRSPVIDRRYLLSEVPDALRYLEEGQARGKIVITV